MPELPEVETIVKGLKKEIIGKKIIEVLINCEMIIAYPDIEDFIKEINNRVIFDIYRRGKYILFKLDGSKIMVIHLRMTGKLLIKNSSDNIDKHTHIIFKFDDKNELRFNNIRKFGRVYLINDDEWENAGGLNKLGPEPLSKEFTLKKFKEALSSRKAKIKALLLNQKFLAGMGNIYTDESLHEAGIKPDRRADMLKDVEIERLFYAIKKLLKEGIQYGGTSFSDYVNAIGEKGSFQHKLKVYQREGEKCLRCDHKIIKDKIAGRSSYYCSHCQN